MTEVEDATPTTKSAPPVDPPVVPQEPPAHPPTKPADSSQGWDWGGGEDWPETPEAANQRLKLAELICQGESLQAITKLSSDYTSLVQTMPSILFTLRCRHFIELVGIKPLPSFFPSRPSIYLILNCCFFAL